MTTRKLLGLLVAVAGIIGGAFFTALAGLLSAGYWNEALTARVENRAGLLAIAVIGALAGYGIYRIGRSIAR
ncbi:MAG TPA: hypothetical protein VHD34_05555 [Xanthobacteraceae bacterium]|nr:hypothetical protein [Xanthobacteraceae bacterium]